MCDILYKLRSIASKSKEQDVSYEHSDINLRREALFGNLKMPKTNIEAISSQE